MMPRFCCSTDQSLVELGVKTHKLHKMPKKEKQKIHSLLNASIPNKFYFISYKPEQYNAVIYFKTFAGLQSSQKKTFHGYWRVALDTLVKCSARSYQSHGQRLMSEWNTPSKGLGDFWKHLSEIESAESDTINHIHIEKTRSGLSFDDDQAKVDSKQQQRGAALNDDDKQLRDMENGETAAVSDGAVSGMDGQDDVDDYPLRMQITWNDLCLSLQQQYPRTLILKAGGGDPDCSRECQSPYKVNGVDVSDIPWDYRSKILEKAERMEPLELVERL
ncbi:hypothetical protein BGZ46_003208 [Entomortierella lignicola]|nr:hypothetical protein BGZ46_003208 [Entomortierella lignicola]